jgi:ubiquinone/menaquinone biosynthesis C-methylase UbiE
MKKNLISPLCAIFLMIPSLGFPNLSQEHQHRDENRKHYEERLERFKVRMYWQMPQRVMDELGIREGMNIADVGAGIGYFSLRLSEKVGAAGKVYASDIDKNALAFLDARRIEAGLNNITVIHGRADDPLIPQTSVDLILIVNTIHLVKEKTSFLNNIRKSLKENGKVVFVQWNAEKMDTEAPGWDSQDREQYTLRTMLKMIYAADYEVLEIMDFLPMQLIYICQPSEQYEKFLCFRRKKISFKPAPNK